MLYTGRLGQRHFSVKKQRDMIAGHGATCLIIPTVSCPCLLKENLTDPLCANCLGSGRYPQPQLQQITTLALLQDKAKDNDYEAGTWTSGDVICLVPPEISLSQDDTVTVLDIRDTFNEEILQRGIQDKVRFQQGVVLELVLDELTVYRPTLDYILTPPATVAWVLGGNAPPTLGRYTVRYSAHPTYAVNVDNPGLRLENHTEQAQKVLLKRLDRLDPQRPFTTP